MATKGRGSQQAIRERHLKDRPHICEVCNYGGMVEVHHKLPVSEGGSNDESNLIVLCEVCHNAAHGKKTRNFLDQNRKNWNGKNAYLS